MKLSQLLKRIDFKPPASLKTDLEISSICFHSKDVKPGALFVAINGNKHRGSDFAKEAVRNGAVCLAGDIQGADCLDFPPPLISLKDPRLALALMADEFFGRPSERIKVIGITGTNGKTTITYLLKNILEKAEFPCGIIGTIEHSFKNRAIGSVNTTPDAIGIAFLLKEMADSGCGYCAMEVSSHALDQERTRAVNFEAAIFTNLTGDHLDYHLNPENYFLSKSRLFSSLGKNRAAIINMDSPFALRLKSLTKARIVGYAINNDSDVTARTVISRISGSEFIIKHRKTKVRIKTPLIGAHNVYNILAAAAFALTQKISWEAIKEALENFPGVKGRLERIPLSQGRSVFVDYAHTPDGLENVLSALKGLTGKNLILVFGCGGDRDRAKRPIMGQIAAKYADRIIITSDNPRGEDPKDIAGEISPGIKNKEYDIILDRKEAIGQALKLSGDKDIILIAGKGHENCQVFKDKSVEFDDVQIVKGLALSKN